MSSTLRVVPDGLEGMGVSLDYKAFCSRVAEEPRDLLDRKIADMTGTVLTRNKAELLTSGSQIFSLMEEDILRATQRVDVKTFMWADDSTGWHMRDTLMRAARGHRHMPLKVSLDRYGDSLLRVSGDGDGMIPKAIAVTGYVAKSLMGWLKYPHLRLEHVVQFFNDPTCVDNFSPEVHQDIEAFTSEQFERFPLNSVVQSLRDAPEIHFELVDGGIAHADHSKLLVADDTVHVSGVNIKDCYSGGHDDSIGWIGGPHWRDYSVRLQGPAASVVRHETLGETNFPSLGKVPEGSPVRFLRNRPGKMERAMDSSAWAREKQASYAFLKLITEARKSIVLDHCYCMDESVVELLQWKADQGIEVTVFTGDPENFLTSRGNHRFLKMLSAYRGIRLLRKSGVSHAKLLHVDGRYSLIGSLNASTDSIDYYGEAAVMVTGDNTLQREICAQIEQLGAY